MYQSGTMFFAVLACAIFIVRRVRRYLRFLQQQDYNSARFLKWVWDNRAFDSRGLLAILPALLAELVAKSNISLVCVANILSSTALVGVALLEEDPTKVGKIPLNMTERAARIYRTAVIVVGTLIVLVLVFLSNYDSSKHYWWFFVILFQLVPLLLALANLILLPGEKRIQEAFRREAEQILEKVNPTVIGITGSYGKTSSKAILSEILNTCLAPTFSTPKSFNTIMGITREIRERMKPGTRFAIMEMGAYKLGSIRRLCEFTPPQVALVTAVGIMHLERFGSPENVYRAKSELAQAVPRSGIIVGNGDDPLVLKMLKENPKQVTLLYGMGSDRLDCRLSQIKINSDGCSFVVEWKGDHFSGFTKMLGRPALYNLLGAFTVACALGCDPRFALAAIRNIQPVNNRLSIRKVNLGGDKTITFLDDAYNSNPVGFRAALEVLESIPGKRKILVTPGMVELGDQAEIENREVGRIAGKICDLALIVGSTNRGPLVEGLKSAGMATERIFVFDERDSALEHLTNLQLGGDVVLIENDLPDLYEINTSF